MAAQVADELRRRILAGEIEKGTQLRQEQLAAEFGVSKVPVREALHQLEAGGFIVQESHRSAVVAGLSPDEILEVFEIRTQIEVWLIGLAMPNQTPQDVQTARKYADKIRDTNDPSAYPTLNWRFHESLYIPANKPLALEYAEKLHSKIERYVRLQFSIAQTVQDVAQEHETLLDLYVRKDPRAKEFLTSHILDSAKKLVILLTQLNEQRAERAHSPA